MTSAGKRLRARIAGGRPAVEDAAVAAAARSRASLDRAPARTGCDATDRSMVTGIGRSALWRGVCPWVGSSRGARCHRAWPGSPRAGLLLGARWAGFGLPLARDPGSRSPPVSMGAGWCRSRAWGCRTRDSRGGSIGLQPLAIARETHVCQPELERRAGLGRIVVGMLPLAARAPQTESGVVSTHSTFRTLWGRSPGENAMAASYASIGNLLRKHGDRIFAHYGGMGTQ